MIKRLNNNLYKNLKYLNLLGKYNFTGQSINYSCGDKLTFQILEENNIIKDIAFQSESCLLSQVAADKICKYIIKKNIDYINSINKDNILDIIGVKEVGPLRLKCILLTIEALKNIKKVNDI